MEFGFIAFAVLLLVLILLVKNKAVSSANLYVQQPALFSKAELSFLKVLDSAVQEHYRVFAKVRIADVLTPTKGMGRKEWLRAFAKISSKHFDYVLCDKKTFEIVAAVELDDRSHNTGRAIKRDSVVNAACAVAELPLVRFKTARSYKVFAVRERILQAVREIDETEVPLLPIDLESI